MLLVEYGGLAVKVSPLSIDIHIKCLLIGATSLIVSVILKKIPDSFYNTFPLFQVKEELM